MERKLNAGAVAVDGDGAPSLLLRGIVDLVLAAELHRNALALLTRGEDAAVDCREVERLDAPALQVILALRDGLRLKGKNLRMEGASAQLEELMRLAGFADLFQ